MKILNMKTITNSGLRAFFDLELDNGFILKGFKVASGPEGLFVGNPSEKGKDGKYYDRVVVPKDVKVDLNRLALAEYDRMTGKAEQPSSSSGDLPF
jgi:stage V sporulation protein G